MYIKPVKSECIQNTLLEKLTTHTLMHQKKFPKLDFCDSSLLLCIFGNILRCKYFRSFLSILVVTTWFSSYYKKVPVYFVKEWKCFERSFDTLELENHKIYL